MRKTIIAFIATLILGFVLVCPCTAYNRIKVEMANGANAEQDFNTREEINTFINENIPYLSDIIKDVKPTNADDDDKTEMVTLKDGFTTITIWRDRY